MCQVSQTVTELLGGGREYNSIEIGLNIVGICVTWLDATYLEDISERRNGALPLSKLLKTVDLRAA